MSENADHEKWMQEYHERRAKEREEQEKTNKETWKLVRAAFEKYGIASAKTHYDGGGDSGEFRSGHYTMSDGTKRSPLPGRSHWDAAADTEVPLEVLEAFIGRPATKSEWDAEKREWVTKEYGEERLEDALLDLAGGLVDREHSGWENNEGGQGVVTFTRDDVKVHHEDNIIEVCSYEYTYAFGGE
jgi:hypothetical protein